MRNGQQTGELPWKSLTRKQIYYSVLFAKKKSIQGIIKEIEEVCEKVKSYDCVHRYLRFLGAKPFHQVPSPFISTVNVNDRLWFVNYLSKWDIEDFMNLAPSDEFFIYVSCCPNYQNDWIWTIDIDDIPENVKVRQSSKHPACIRIFLLFTAKKMLPVVKDEGHKWSGDYFIEVILAQHVILLLKNSRF